MIKLGIIGCGRQASKLMVAIEELNLFEIVALCDIDPSAIDTILHSLLNKEAVLKTKDYKELIESENVEAVMISTPTYFHVEPALYALKHHKDIFLEKPLATNIDEIDDLILKTSDSTSIIQVGFPFHHSYFFNTIQTMFNENEYGKCKYIHVVEHRGPFLGHWFYEKDKSGGTINDKLIHFFDISNTTFSGKPISVYASGSQHYYHKNMLINELSSDSFKVPNPEIVDHTAVVVNYDDSSILSIALNMYQTRPIEGLDLRFTTLNGKHIRCFGDGSEVNIELVNSKHETELREVENKEDSDTHGLNHPGAKEEFRNFAKSIRGRIEPEANLWRARNAQIIALAAEKSLITGKVESLEKYNNEKVEKVSLAKGWNKNPIFTKHKLILKNGDGEKTNYDFVDRLYLSLRKYFPKKGNTRKLSLKDINHLISKINSDSNATTSLSNIKENIILVLPWGKFNIKIENGKAALVNNENQSSCVEIVLNEKGYRSVVENKSMTKAYLMGDIKLKGDLSKFQKNRKGLEIIVKHFRAQALN